MIFPDKNVFNIYVTLYSTTTDFIFRVFMLFTPYFLPHYRKNSFSLLPKLEKLNLSDMHLLKSIDEGAFHNLLALRHFTCQRNIHLSTIHPHAFGNLGNQTQKDWPPLQSVSYFYSISVVVAQIL